MSTDWPYYLVFNIHKTSAKVILCPKVMCVLFYKFIIMYSPDYSNYPQGTLILMGSSAATIDYLCNQTIYQIFLLITVPLLDYHPPLGDNSITKQNSNVQPNNASTLASIMLLHYCLITLHYNNVISHTNICVQQKVSPCWSSLYFIVKRKTWGKFIIITMVVIIYIIQQIWCDCSLLSLVIIVLVYMFIIIISEVFEKTITASFI